MKTNWPCDHIVRAKDVPDYQWKFNAPQGMLPHSGSLIYIPNEWVICPLCGAKKPVTK